MFEKAHDAVGVDDAQVGVHVDYDFVAQDRAFVFGTNHTFFRRRVGIQQTLCRQVGEYVCAGGQYRIAIIKIANQQIAILFNSGMQGGHVVCDVVCVARCKDILSEDKLVAGHRDFRPVCDSIDCIVLQSPYFLQMVDNGRRQSVQNRPAKTVPYVLPRTLSLVSLPTRKAQFFQTATR